MRVWKRDLDDGYTAMIEKWPELAHRFTTNHLGTLGTGNHFIEVCVELREDGSVDRRIWVTLHSGSRGIGNHIGTFFTRRARAELKHEGLTLPDPELAFLRVGDEMATDYMTYAEWAQRYAWNNRLLMFCDVLEGIREALGVSKDEPELAGDTVHWPGWSVDAQGGGERRSRRHGHYPGFHGCPLVHHSGTGQRRCAQDQLAWRRTGHEPQRCAQDHHTGAASRSPAGSRISRRPGCA